MVDFVSNLILSDRLNYFANDLLFPMFKLFGFLHETIVAAPAIICLSQLLTDRKHLLVQLNQQTLNGYYKSVFGTLIDLLTR